MRSHSEESEIGEFWYSFKEESRVNCWCAKMSPLGPKVFDVLIESSPREHYAELEADEDFVNVECALRREFDFHLYPPAQHRG